MPRREKQRRPVHFNQFSAVCRRGERWRRWNNYAIFLIGVRGCAAEQNRIAPFQIEGQAALRTVQRTRAADLDLFEFYRVAAVQRGFESLVSIQVDPAKTVLQQSFGVGAGLVGIARLIPVGSVWRDRNL